MQLTPWQQPILDSLRQRHAAGALPHAVLLAGDAGLGKRSLAEQLTWMLLCPQAEQGVGCRQCHACRLLQAGTHPDLYRVALETNTQGNLRREIVVEQVRELSGKLAMTSQLGGRRMALIDPADTLNRAAANALLKTLEEPPADVVLVLVADQPWRLPATVRSRCQAFTLHRPARDAALTWLSEQGVEPAAAALDAAGGNPGLARRWHADGVLALEQEVRADLQDLRQRRCSALDVAQRWAEQDAPQRLWFAARHAAEQARQRARGEVGAAGTMSTLGLLDWYQAALQAEEDLRSTLRPTLVLYPLLASWH